MLLELLDLAEPERAAHLQRRAPGADHDRLLALAAEADGDSTLAGEFTALDEELRRVAGAAQDEARARLGEVVGNYRLVRLIGEGGMGAVYLAERRGDYQHTAAIKLARSATVSERLLERLAQERQILADLDHPNIASLLDGGSTARGDVYLVLEYVDGQPITRHCRERGLDWRSKVRLFLEVCDAVQAAHRALLVHGDLKPSNILVRDDGVPKLLDFGVARALSAPDRGDPDRGDEVLGFTPGFASPEQLSGRAIGVASDVYSLGVLLYLLLTGRMPFVLPQIGADAATCLDTQVRQRPPAPAPRLLAGSGSLPRDTSRELDAVVLRCLEPAAADRYATVEELSRDLRHLLDGLPVSAVDGGRLYAVRKFVQRHAVATAMSVIGAVALLATAAVAVQQAATARREAVSSERARDRADRTNAFLLDIFRSADIDQRVSRGPEVRVVEVLEAASDRLWADDALLPDDRVGFAVTILGLHQNLQQHEAARALLERVTEYLEEAEGVSAIHRARVLRVAAHAEQTDGDWEASAEAFAGVLEVLEQAYGRTPEAEDVLDLELATRAEYLFVLRTLYRCDEGLEVVEQAYGRTPEAEDVLDLELATRAEYLFVLRTLYRCDEGLAVVQPVLTVGERLLASGELADSSLVDNVSGALSNSASCAWAEADFARAYELSLRALELLELRDDSTEQVAATRNNCGFYALELGRWAEARRHYRDAIAVSDRLGVGEIKNGHRYLMLARAEAGVGEPAAARTSLALGLSLVRSAGSGDTASLALALARAAEVRVALGEIGEAVEDLEQSIAMAEAAGLRGGRWAEHRGRLAELLHSRDPREPRVVALLDSALAGDQLTGNRRELQIRARLERLRAAADDVDRLTSTSA
ncbi:MAG: serine/threonine protein kinase [Acidobacteria bacterium]|nr:MAG: serine/threonine protein kinase [Acidobacteriota bacterium]